MGDKYLLSVGRDDRVMMQWKVRLSLILFLYCRIANTVY